VNLIAESGTQVIVRALKVVGEAGVRRVVAQGSLEPVSRRPPLRDEPTNRYTVTRDDDRLTVLDRVEDVGEAPCRLRGSYRNHEYTLSDLVCLYVYENVLPLVCLRGAISVAPTDFAGLAALAWLA
jgi:hypothetical protein